METKTKSIIKWSAIIAGTLGGVYALTRPTSPRSTEEKKNDVVLEFSFALLGTGLGMAIEGLNKK